MPENQVVSEFDGICFARENGEPLNVRIKICTNQRITDTEEAVRVLKELGIDFIRLENGTLCYHCGKAEMAPGLLSLTPMTAIEKDKV